MKKQSKLLSLSLPSLLLFNLILFNYLFLCYSKTFTLKDDKLWPTEEEINKLANSLKGTLISDQNVNYTTPYTWNLRTGPPRPAFIIKPLNADDIIKVIEFARFHILRISVKSTGHHQDIRNSADDAIQLDMSLINHKLIDLNEKTITVGPGQPFADIHTFINQQSNATLVALSGAEPGVGPAGWVLGGGHGRLTRLYGLGVDALIRVQMVLSNGKQVNVSMNENSDLFWALRGSGGSTFGIIYSLTFQLFNDPGPMSVMSGYFPITDDVADNFQSWLYNAPNNAGSYYSIGTRITSKPYLVLSAFCFDSNENCDRILSPLIYIGNCSATLGATCKVIHQYINYNEFLMATKDNRDSAGDISAYLVSTAFNFSTPSQLAIINQWIRNYSRADWPQSVIACSGNGILGGKSAQLDYNQKLTVVAPAMRQSLMAITCVVAWSANGKNRQDLIDKIDQWADSTLRYVGVDQWVFWNEPQHNFASNIDWQSRYWGGLEIYNKLKTIKIKYDPDNIFTCYHCIGWEDIQNVDPGSCPDNCSCSNQKQSNTCAYSYNQLIN
eukprot:TRINITY_DN544_c0_g2_i1.p1 TRINITY_DN544_c0_g2~~TRINITY_DN544_c0_g2_i1.p1  ORF type:complete len:555 (+),score=241.79 TRINITY_DN544_c0_g2_i1:91-1755(+)